MPKYDRNILSKNIRSLMDKKRISQTKLAEETGITQPSLSKALSDNASNSFTLDQVISIAEYFHVSIDSLLGMPDVTKGNLTCKEICKFIIGLIENSDIKVFDYSVNEYVYDMECNEKGDTKLTSNFKDNVYKAFYFPSYYQISPNCSQQEYSSYICDIYAECGNYTRHYSTNTFINQFLKVYSLYKDGTLEEEIYKSAVEGLLNHLSE